MVLGAGGPLGWVYHLGVIEGIRRALGVEPAQADRVVGTSAGGAIAATLLAGATSGDVLEAIAKPMTPEQRDEMRAAAGSFRRQPLRRFRPQAPRLIRRRDLIGLTGLLPAGVFPTFAMRRFPVGDLAGHEWPANLWVPSIRLSDGEVIVFGRDRHDTDIRDALEATSAVPGLFQPKVIGDERFIDGAVASATHADLLVDGTRRTPSRVVISSPMTRPGRGVVRTRARRQLVAEVAALHDKGASVVVLEPDAEIVALADGFPRTNGEAGPTIVAEVANRTAESLERTMSGRGPTT